MRNRITALLFSFILMVCSVGVMSVSANESDWTEELERLIADTYEKSDALKKKAIELYRNNTYPTDDWGRAEQLAPLFSLGLAKEANEVLASFSNHYTQGEGNGSHYFSLPVYVKTYIYYGTNGIKTPNLITRENEDVMLEAMWQMADTDAEFYWEAGDLSKDIDITSTENHDLVKRISRYLMCQILKDNTVYRKKLFSDGKTPQQHYDLYTEYFKAFLKIRAQRSPFIEMGAQSYSKYTHGALVALYDCVPDGELKTIVKMFLDIAFIEDAIATYNGYVRGGGLSRAAYKIRFDTFYLHTSLLDDFDAVRSMLYGEATTMAIGVPTFAVSDYRLPKIAIALRYGLKEKSVPAFEIINKCIELGDAGNTESERNDELALVNYIYRTPYYMIGGYNRDLNVLPSVLYTQHYMSSLVFNGDYEQKGETFAVPAIGKNVRAIIPFPIETSSRTVNAYWAFYHKNVMIFQKTYRDNKYVDNSFMRLNISPYFGLNDKIVEKNGWVFVNNDTAFAAIRPVVGGYFWDDSKDNSVPQNKENLYLTDPNAAVIIHAGDINEYCSFEKFMDKILTTSSIKFNTSDTFVYKSANLPDIEYNYWAEKSLPKVGSVTVDLYPEMSLNSPYLKCDLGSGIVKVDGFGYSSVYDFNEAKLQETFPKSTISSVEQTETASEAVFSDISGHWAQTSIENMAFKSVVNGVTEETFEPDSHITVGQFLSMIERSLKLTPETPVNEDDWYLYTFQTAADNGLIPSEMTINGIIDLGAFITREEMAVVIVNGLKAKEAVLSDGADVTMFTDYGEISAGAEEAVGIVSAMGIMTGLDETVFGAKELATRAQAAVILERLLNLSF